MDNELGSLDKYIDILFNKAKEGTVDKPTKELINHIVTELHEMVKDMENSNIKISRTDLVDSINIPKGMTRKEVDRVFSSSIDVPLTKCVLEIKKSTCNVITGSSKNKNNGSIKKAIKLVVYERAKILQVLQKKIKGDIDYGK